jgi:DNA-binding transcriptional LysR family regulator
MNTSFDEPTLAVNRQLLQLGDEVGSPLFERLPKGLRLTPVGEILSRHVITVLQDAQQMSGELDALKGIRRGAVDVVAVEALTAPYARVFEMVGYGRSDRR